VKPFDCVKKRLATLALELAGWRLPQMDKTTLFLARLLSSPLLALSRDIAENLEDVLKRLGFAL